MLESLSVDGLRNLTTQVVDLSPGHLVLVSGANAQGKSSLLEAIYMLATTRSFRARDPREAIAHDADQLHLSGRLRAGAGGPLELGISRGRGRGDRRLRVGEYEVELAEYLEHLPALVTTGESTRSVAGSPSERRRYIDRATAAAQPGHLPDLAEYRKLLAQRNQLLRSEATDDEIEPWDQLLARVGERIVARRNEQFAAWQDELGAWSELFPEGAGVRLIYRRAGGGTAAKVATVSLEERLEQARRTDRRLGVTTVGPHRDDLGLELEGRDLWRFGSAGQVRSAIAALTLAQARRVRSERPGGLPLLILDDVDSDLDAERFRGLLLAASAEAQVFAATSKPEMVHGLEATHLRVHEGAISPIATAGDAASNDETNDDE